MHHANWLVQCPDNSPYTARFLTILVCFTVVATSSTTAYFPSSVTLYIKRTYRIFSSFLSDPWQSKVQRLLSYTWESGTSSELLVQIHISSNKALEAERVPSLRHSWRKSETRYEKSPFTQRFCNTWNGWMEIRYFIVGTEMYFRCYF